MNRYLILAGILLQSFCSFTASGQTTDFDNDYSLGNATYTFIPTGDYNETSNKSYGGFNSLSVGNLTSCQLVVKYSVAESGPGPVCYLEVISNELVNRTHYWTKPCPATPQKVPVSGFWCQFEFALDGNLLLKSGAANVPIANGTVLWSSNTSGLGATSLGLLDSDPEVGLANFVLYNAKKEIVWRAIANSSASEDYRCSYTNYQAPPPAAGRKLLQHY